MRLKRPLACCEIVMMMMMMMITCMTRLFEMWLMKSLLIFLLFFLIFFFLPSELTALLYRLHVIWSTFRLSCRVKYKVLEVYEFKHTNSFIYDDSAVSSKSPKKVKEEFSFIFLLQCNVSKTKQKIRKS